MSAYMDAKMMRRFEERFVVTVDGCWTWCGARNYNGYGLFRINGKQHRAHRIAYFHWNGKLQANHIVHHQCHNHACVNPSHLEGATVRTNTLLGNSPTAMNARKSQCIHGHPLLGKNLCIDNRGHRNCRECDRARSRAAAALARAAREEGGAP